MNNAIILCPGPSLASWHPHRADLVIAVNRAAIAHDCDVWACGDAPLIERIQDDVRGSPLLLTGADSHSTIDTHGRRWRGEVFHLNDMFSYCPHVLNWCLFTSTIALIYAAYRGAKIIRLVGCDWSGTRDFDGVEAGQNRSEARWQTERDHVQGRFVPWLAATGVEVIRVA